MSTLEIPKTEISLMFGDVTRGEAKYGAVEYRKIFAINMNPTDDFYVGRLWLLMQPNEGVEVAIGLGTLTDTDGELITYSAPMSAQDAIYLGDLPPGSITPIWLRRVVHAGTPEFDRGFFQLAFTGKAALGV
jgi:hypothetical protein